MDRLFGPNQSRSTIISLKGRLAVFKMLLQENDCVCYNMFFLRVMVMMDRKTQERAATSIQSFWRGHSARKKFAVSQLPPMQMTSYETFLVGNDPKITGLDDHVSADGEKIALIGTSGLRSLALACQLGNRQTIPKLIIVDNSLQVIQFWRNLRHMVAEGSFHHKDDFLSKSLGFLVQNQTLFRSFRGHEFSELNTDTLKYENQDPVSFLDHLIVEFGLPYVCKTIENSVIIAGSWTDRQLFISLKNILGLNQIDKSYIYPSNIPYYIEEVELADFFNNIIAIGPKLSIITSRCCPVHQLPENFILTAESDATTLRGLVIPSATSTAGDARGVAPQWGGITVFQLPPEIGLLFQSFLAPEFQSSTSAKRS